MADKWWKYPKFGEKTKEKLESKAEKSGLKLPSWALYPKAEGFEYVGFLRKSDRKIDSAGLYYGDDPKHLKTMKENPKIMKESDTFGISPYLTESAGEITPKTYRDKESTRKIKVEGYEGRTHPLPDKEKQERMHKRARKWSREGPLLPKEPLKTKSDLTQTQRGRNARKKLEQIVDWNVHDGTNDRGFPIIITGVNVGKGQKRTRGGGKWVWAAYVGDVRVTEGKTFYDEKGNIRGRAPSKVKGGISRRRRVKGGRDTTVLDVEAIAKVKCPLKGCLQPKGKNCVIAKGENQGKRLPVAKTHGARVRKYVKDVLKKDWAYGKGKGQYRGDTGE